MLVFVFYNGWTNSLKAFQRFPVNESAIRDMQNTIYIGRRKVEGLRCHLNCEILGRIPILTGGMPAKIMEKEMALLRRPRKFDISILKGGRIPVLYPWCIDKIPSYVGEKE